MDNAIPFLLSITKTHVVVAAFRWRTSNITCTCWKTNSDNQDCKNVSDNKDCITTEVRHGHFQYPVSA